MQFKMGVKGLRVVKITTSIFIFCLLLVSFQNSTTGGRSYYISAGPEGNDNNYGDSPTTPWKTFGHAIPQLNPGDTLYLLDGVYNTNNGTGFLQVDCRASVNPACGNVPGQNYPKYIPSFAQGKNGQKGSPITVKALDPRQAYLAGNGSEPAPVYLNNCQYWVLDGLRARANDSFRPDVLDQDGHAIDKNTGVFYVACSDNIQLSHLFGEYNNREYDGSIIDLYSTSNSTVSQSEAYNHHRHGMAACCQGPGTLVSNFNNAFQQDYVDAQPEPGGQPCDAVGWSTPGTPSKPGQVICAQDLVCDSETPSLCGGVRNTASMCSGLVAGDRCGWPSHNPGKLGDEGITLYWANNSYIENSITLHGEGQQATGYQNQIQSGIVLHSVLGVNLGRNQTGEGANVTEGYNLAENMVIVGDPTVGSGGTGIQFCAGDHDRAQKITVASTYYGVQGAGLGATFCQPTNKNINVSFAFQDVLMLQNTASGKRYPAWIQGSPDCWNGNFLNIWQYPGGNTYAPPAPNGNWTNSLQIPVTAMYDPATKLGTLVYVPTNSNMITAGAQGSSLGANTTCLYNRGTITGNMWDYPTTGEFSGCLWYSPGSAADIAASEGYSVRCSNIHQQLNIGTGGGKVPGCMTGGANGIIPTMNACQ